MKILRQIIIIIAFLHGFQVSAQGLKAFRLPNGLSVFVWEDHTKPDVRGMVSVKVGAKDDPADLTGLAHYLEHVMFKGTSKIGALDWAKEEPLYGQIIRKYDEMAAENHPARKKEIAQEINQLSVEISKISYSTEFSALTEGTMGGNGLNAMTSYDYTLYYNSFPAEEIERWLELNSERLINPIFRGFQAELETVYEEYNMYQDNRNEQMNRFMLENIFQGHPYSRPAIGYGEHLKNPRLSQLIEFYNSWYVPGNMALILVGNVKAEEIIPAVSRTFGRLESRPAPTPLQYPDATFRGRKGISSKISPSPQLRLAYPGVTLNHPDRIVLSICAAILSNSSNTGLLDKLSIDGDLAGNATIPLFLKEQGRIIVIAVPYYDVNQRRFNSLKATEKLVLKEIKKLQEGKFDEELIDAIKGEMIRNYDLMMESSEQIINQLLGVFVYDVDPAEFLEYKEIVNEITLEDIKAAAQKYFGNNYTALLYNQGRPAKKENLDKPDMASLQPPQRTQSEYARQLEALPVKRIQTQFADMNEVQTRLVNERSKLFYTKNPENDVFSICIKYGIGTEKAPKLEYATRLMNNAGIMGLLEAQEVKQAFSELGATCRYAVDDSYLYVIMEGFEDNLETSCQLMTRQILMPRLDEKQWNNLKGQIYFSRSIEKTQVESINAAMINYLFYGEKSDMIDRLPIEEVVNLTYGNLAGEFQRATDYEAEIHYVGNLPFDEVYDILSKNLPLKQFELESASPAVKPLATYHENTVYFVPFNDAKQSSVYFYVEGANNTKADDVLSAAFSYYFSQGFNSIIMQEIREFRSMAYSAAGMVRTPVKPNYPAFYIGALGTQADNTIEAVDLFFSLLTDMPEYPERMTRLKNFLRQTALMDKPDFRTASQTYESWKLRGYDKSPAEENLEKIDRLSFEDIKKYYEEHIKGKTIAISVVGDPRQVDVKALEKYGKVVRLTPAKLFSEK